MSEHNPYAFLTPIAMKFFHGLEAAKNTARHPTLTLVSATERNIHMETPEEPCAAPIESALLSHHEAYQEMEKVLRSISVGVAALKGIGEMMRPYMADGGEELKTTRRSDVSAIFEFFGEALLDRVETANEAVGSLEFVKVIKGE